VLHRVKELLPSYLSLPRLICTRRDQHDISCTHWMKSWKVHSRSANEEIIPLLWNPRIHYCIHRSPPLDSVLSQMNPVHILTPLSIWIHFTFIFPPMPNPLKWFLPFSFFQGKLCMHFSFLFLSSPQRPDQHRGPPSLLSNGYRGIFPRGYSGSGLNLATRLSLVPRSRMVELYLHLTLCLHGIVLN
jgi:hypothetical protein